MVIKELLKKVSPLAGILKLPIMAMYEILENKEKAEQDYIILVADIKGRIKNNHETYNNSPDLRRAIEALSELPQWGAKRTNFRKRYLQDLDTNTQKLLELPDDPSYFNGQGLFY